MLIFEFYSGIGGLHQGYKNIIPNHTKNNFDSYKILPFDVNLNANLVYSENFQIQPDTLSLEYLKLAYYDNICKKNLKLLNVNRIMWLMSPPCQPFTSGGKRLDIIDERTNSFKHLVNNLLNISDYSPDFILLENTSDACMMLLEALNKRRYSYLQFILSPEEFNIPNMRTRYYLIARGPNLEKFDYEAKDKIISDIKLLNCHTLNREKNYNLTIKEYLNMNLNFELDSNIDNLYLDKIFPQKLNKNFTPHFCFQSSFNTTCFTKSYGTLHKGSGSVLILNEDLQNLNSEMFYKNLNQIRFFSDKEIMKFLCFNQDFKISNNFSMRDKYKLLGNSVNVKVVTELLKYLFKF